MWKRLSFKLSKPSTTTVEQVGSTLADVQDQPGPVGELLGTKQTKLGEEQLVPTSEDPLTDDNSAQVDVTNVQEDAFIREEESIPRSLDRSKEGSTLQVPREVNGAQDSSARIYRRFSFRSLAFFYGRDKGELVAASASASAVSLVSQASKNEKVKASPGKEKLSKSFKEARATAVALRTIMLGPSATPLPSSTAVPGRAKLKASKAPPVPSLDKVKSQLSKPKTANIVIAQLRKMPLPDGPSFHATRAASAESLVSHPDNGGSPIHAVCLSCTEEEAEKNHFSKLQTGHNLSTYATLMPVAPSAQSKPATMGTASLESLVSVLRDLRIVSLLQSPDLGFGQPVDAEDSGPLTGSVPSAGTVLEGFEEITKQLMALGFASTKMIYPNHDGIYPPTDRISVLTYWWGLELVLPEPSVDYLGKVHSISNTLLNILSVMSTINEGVREILPFIRYISNFVDVEWSAIKAQDMGQGVVCAATWIMPAALIPRPWDFKPKPNDPSASNPSQASANAPKPKTPSTVPSSDLDTKLPTITPGQPLPITPGHSMPQLMITTPTLPRGFNAQQIVSAE